VVLRGSFTAGAIVDFARELPATLIAMNTHAHSGMARLALGSIAPMGGAVGLSGACSASWAMSCKSPSTWSECPRATRADTA